MRLRQKKWLLFFWIVLVLAAAGIAAVGAARLSESPFEGRRAFNEPSYVANPVSSMLLIIDSSKTRVSVLNEDHAITATINGGSRGETGFYYAQYAISDGEDIYVADVCYADAGTKIFKERVMRFSMSGDYEGTTFEIAYQKDDMPMQNGNISALQYNDGKLTFIVKDSDLLSLYQISGGKAALKRSVLLKDIQYIHHTYYNAPKDSISFTTKDGRIYTENGDGFSMALDWSGSTGDQIVWELAADSDGVLYCSDLGANQIVDLLSGRHVLSEPGMLIYRLTISDDNVLAFTDNSNIMLSDLNGKLLYQADSADFSTSYTAWGLIVWVCAAFLALTVLTAAAALMIHFAKAASSPTRRTALLLGAVIVLTSVLVAVSILRSTSQRLRDKTLNNLRETATSLSLNSGRTFGDKFENITRIGDYAGENYNDVMSFLNVYCNAAYDSGSNMYYVLLRLSGSMVYCVMDYENTTGTIYPYLPYDGTEYAQAVESNQVVAIGASADSYGYWAYAVAPVYDSDGKLAGLLEIGSDLYGEQLQTRALIKNVVLATAALILIILLLLTELTALAQCIAQKRILRYHAERSVPDFVRPLAFLIFCAENGGSAFMPQLSQKLFASSSLPLPDTLGAAFPISMQLLAVAALAFFGGYLVDRHGIKKILLAGLLVQMSGNLLTAFSAASGSYLLLLGGKTLSGCGMGAAVISLNAMPAFADGEKQKEALFSGLNLGILAGVVVGASVGSYLAGAAGYVTVFSVSAVLSLAAFFLAEFSVEKNMHADTAKMTDDTPKSSADGRKELALWSYLISPKVFSFLLFVMLPFLIMMYFKDYLFPLFANGKGYTDADIGNVLLFAGAASIYLTAPLSDLALKYLHPKGTAVLAGLFYITALAMFAWLQTTAAAVLAVFVICLTGGVGLISHGVYYSSLPETDLLGKGKAMGVYSLADNLSQAIGPMLFGALLVLGYGKAGLIVAASALALLIMFVLLNRRTPGSQKRKKRDVSEERITANE